MRRTFFLICLAALLAAVPAAAKGKGVGLVKQKGAVGKVQTAMDVEVEFLAATFAVDPAVILELSRYGLNSNELALVLYLHGTVGRPLSPVEIRYIAAERNWARLAWYYGLPPIILEDGLLVLRRPWRARMHPPLGRAEYRREHKGAYDEKIEIRPGSYEYIYRNKRLGVEEKLEITNGRYEYRYRDRRIEERLEVDLRTCRYEYRYSNRMTRQDIRKTGIGRPLTPELLYRQMRRERERTPGFRLSVRINF